MENEIKKNTKLEIPLIATVLAAPVAPAATPIVLVAAPTALVIAPIALVVILVFTKIAIPALLN